MKLANTFQDDIVAAADDLMREEWHAAMFNVDHKLDTISNQLDETQCRLLVVGKLRCLYHDIGKDFTIMLIGYY